VTRNLRRDNPVGPSVVLRARVKPIRLKRFAPQNVPEHAPELDLNWQFALRLGVNRQMISCVKSRVAVSSFETSP
jgi:hypothetical protein